MAAAAGIDPLEFRLRNTTEPRMPRRARGRGGRVRLEAGRRSQGQGRAVACSTDAGSYDALMAQVRVDRSDGSVHVERIVCAQDMGTVVNPDGAKMQMEGSITMGARVRASARSCASAAGDILDRNFKTYRSAALLAGAGDRDGDRAGRRAWRRRAAASRRSAPTGAVIANAVFDATGARVLRLPLTPERVREALAAAGPVRAAG